MSTACPHSSDDEHSLFFQRGLDYLHHADDISAGMVNIVRAAGAALGSDCVSLYLLNSKAGALEPFVLVNIEESYLRGCSSVPLGTQCCGRAALHRVPWAVTDMWNDPLFADCAEAARQSGVRARFSVPVLIPDDQCIGTLAAHFYRVHEPTRADIDRLTLFARLISIAIVNHVNARKLKVSDWVAEQLERGARAA